jgi:LPXTG-motif cell wall-anchored protein
MALLVTLPILCLILARMLWSGSSLWFLAIGILFLLAAGLVFLNRRQRTLEFDKQMLDDEPSRWPLVLAGLGVLFLALLVLPNYSGGGSDGTGTVQQSPSQAGNSDVMGNTQAPVQSTPPPQEQPASGEAPAEEPDGGVIATGDSYTVQSGDSLWSIADQHNTTVDALAAANSITNPAELQVGQELVIPPPESEASAE